jgi:hypothetical protein
MAVYMRARAADKAARDEAVRVVERWKAEVKMAHSHIASGKIILWSPTIQAAIMAGMPWLDVYCPGCKTTRAIDIRTIDRHPHASLVSLVLGLRCSWCPGFAPMPVVVGLHQVPLVANAHASAY